MAGFVSSGLYTQRMNYSILLIDDDEDDRFLLETCIKQSPQKLTLSFAKNGVEAMGKLSEGLRPNLILSDAHMPLMNGYEFLQWLMASPAYQHIPIVIWTGELSDREITRYYQVGANSVMLKPNALQGMETFCKHWFELVQLPQLVA